MSFAKTLLAGAAVCALCTAPALARTAPNIHLAGSGFDSPAKLIHSKTNAGNPNVTDITQTFSFSISLSDSSFYRVPVQFNQYTWQNTQTCIAPTRQFMTLAPRKTNAAKITVGSSTGPTSACPNTIFTFLGPLYELKSRNKTSDSFVASLVAKHYFGYHLTLNENWAITITP